MCKFPSRMCKYRTLSGSRTFHAYEEVPQHEVPKLVEAAKKEREELAAAR